MRPPDDSRSLTPPQEAHEKKIDLSDHGESCIRSFVAYLYRLDYDSTSTETDVRMFLLADQYDIAPLKALSLAKIKTKAESWDANFMQRADDGVAEIVSLAYGAYDITFEIRETIIDKMLDLGILCKEPVHELLRDSISTHASFAIDLVVASEKRRKETAEPVVAACEYHIQCPRCSHVRGARRIWRVFEVVRCDTCDLSWHLRDWIVTK